MANVNSLMSSSSSSTSNLYGTRNVLSGLASGMDTEAMIENSVSGYKTKITQLQQQQTKYEWKQDAYRSITDKLYALNETYTSYTSKTNLYSNAFFTNSISTTAVSASTEAAANVSAKGRSSSDIQILAAQAATAASYTVKADALGLQASNASTTGMNLSGVTVGKLKGSMTLDYDGQKIEISFDETDLIDNRTGDSLDPPRAEGAKTLVQAIQDKLKDTTISTKSGSQKASDVITVSAEGGKITFSENTANNKQGATPYVSYIDSTLKTALGATESELYEGSSTKKYTLSNPSGDLTESKSAAAYLAGKDINVTVDGVTKTFRLNQADIESGDMKTAFENAFAKIGVNVNVTASDANGNPPLTFSPADPSSNSNLLISAKDEKVNEILGFGDGVSNYLNTKASIGSLLGSKFDFEHEVPAPEDDSTVLARLNSATADSDGYYTDATTGNRYEKVNDNYYRVSDKGDRLYDLQINGKKVYISKDASLESVLDAINNSDAGVKAAYSKLTGNFTFTSKETGKASNISFDNPLAKSLFTTGDPRQRNLKEIFGLDESVTDFTLKIGSKAIGTTFNANSTVQDLMDAINDKPNAGSAITGYIDYDSATGTFRNRGSDGVSSYWNFKAYDASGSNSISGTVSGTDLFRDLSAAGESRTSGTDATVRATVNGEAITLTRSSNDIEMDGMTVTLKGNVGKMSEYERQKDENGNLETDAAYATRISKLDGDNKTNAVSFTTSGGSEDMIKTIKGFVDEYNAVMKQVYEAFSTQPAEKSSSTHAKYEPLTDDDKSTMSETAIKNYEEKAKQGILFGDSDLRGLYQKLVNAISPGGSDGAVLREIGIDTTYSGGITQIKLNESKLSAALESDPDKVRNAFTKSKDYGASSDGLMGKFKQTMEQYASTSTASMGILVKKAGSTFSSTSLLSNAVQKQIDSVQTQIQKWQTKMSSKIDYYTRQFTALEKLMNTMNSQSSALSGLMGGY